MRDYLMHYGVLGMKWGVRRYQNPDGSLTAAGKKRYSSMSSKGIRNEFKKQIHKARSKQFGWDNQWLTQKPIGENSKAVVDADKKRMQEYYNSPAYKEYINKYDKLTDRYNKGEIDYEEYDSLVTDLSNNIPKLPDRSLRWAKIHTNTGWKYMNDFQKKGGYDLSIAYLKDLGYNDKSAEYLANRMLKKGYTIGDI